MIAAINNLDARYSVLRRPFDKRDPEFALASREARRSLCRARVNDADAANRHPARRSSLSTRSAPLAAIVLQIEASHARHREGINAKAIWRRTRTWKKSFPGQSGRAFLRLAHLYEDARRSSTRTS
jgi:hypothetical protein